MRFVAAEEIRPSGNHQYHAAILAALSVLPNRPRRTLGGEGALEIVTLLIAAGADVNVRRPLTADVVGRGRTVLQQAVMEGYSEVVKALVAAGADVNAPGPISRENETAAFLASKFDFKEGLDVLVEHGAQFLEPEVALDESRVDECWSVEAENSVDSSATESEALGNEAPGNEESEHQELDKQPLTGVECQCCGQRAILGEKPHSVLSKVNRMIEEAIRDCSSTSSA